MSFSSQRLTQQFPCLFSPESVSCMNGLESDDKHSFDATDFPFATEHVLYQFRYYLRHQVLPAVFDPLFLYQWADFLMYEDLVKELAPFVQ
ncbi:MAG: hypothetical protein KGJ02_08510 [Verrucomicrobiota bacterium]|nr:hypothetical protein [Verrucomicrobiota bacterium]